MSGLPEQILISLGGGVITPLPGNENENYLVKNGGRAFVVKKLRGHSASNTEIEAMYRRYLAECNLPVIPYRAWSDSKHVLTLNQDSYVALPYQAGKMANPNHRLNAQAGKILAKVHSLNANTMPKRQNWYAKKYIPDSLKVISDAYADVKEIFSVKYDHTPDFWNGDLPKGIIHGDLQKDNIIVDAEGAIVSIIDWEEAAVEPLLLDVAHSAQQLSFKRGVCDEALFNAFLDAYQKIRALTPLEKGLFDAALRYTMLVLSVWAYVKKSHNEMDDELFRRVGRYHLADYDVPKLRE